MTHPTTSDVFARTIKQAIENQIDDIVRESIELAKTQMTKKIPEIVASVSLKVFHSIRYERVGNELGIFVKIEGLEKL